MAALVDLSGTLIRIFMENTTKKALEARFSAVLDERREEIYGKITSVMKEAFVDIGRILCETQEKNPNLIINTFIKGLSPESLIFIMDLYKEARSVCLDEPIEEVYKEYDFDDNIKQRLILEFLNTHSLSLNVVRSKFPNAYKVWTKEEEKNLSELRGQGKTIQELSQIFQRNERAIQMRLDKLHLP